MSSFHNTQQQGMGGDDESLPISELTYETLQQFFQQNEMGALEAAESDMGMDDLPMSDGSESSEDDRHGEGDTDEDEDEDESEHGDGMAGIESAALTETDMELPSMHSDDRTLLDPVTTLTRLRRATRRRVVLDRPDTDDDDDDDDNDDDNDSGDQTSVPNWARNRRRRRRRPTSELYPPVPNPAGRELMMSAKFGANPTADDVRRRTDRSLERRLMYREINPVPAGMTSRSALTQDLIPGTCADKIIHHEAPCYSGQFSGDGNFFYCCSQDFKVRLYETGNPTEWRHYKTLNYPFGQWTITDATLSPNNRHIAFSSIRNIVCLADTNPNSNAQPVYLDFSRHENRPYPSYFGIWSIQFSPNGREILAGTKDRSVIAYDLETEQSVLRLRRHKDDVNAVCWGEANTPNIIYSGSDDSTVRVWDRRSMADGRESGVFMGHTEGITYIDSKGDGRYALSNGKDQVMKLWDIRKMMETDKFRKLKPKRFTSGYDYRWRRYPIEDFRPHPHDCSVVTFRGHKVLKTLIRCHFSPPVGSNSRYVYTGSADGKVYIYNLDATIAKIIDVKSATLNTRPRESAAISRFGFRFSERLKWKTCVRDASWHPGCPTIAATSWNGWGGEKGTCSIHSWAGELAEDVAGDPPIGDGLDAECNYVEEFNDRAKNTAAIDELHETFRRGGLVDLNNTVSAHAENPITRSRRGAQVWQ